ncbi:MAG: Lrp/AsnC family transcriptional regulator [Deltaproteobacteria bacterium]|nr:Lrp/AsnC family transcriptional regulator [Deltaproteobacteria bacterium]
MLKKLDKIDNQIVSLLQIDGRMPITEISKKVGITEGAVRKRLKKLIEGNTIQVVAIRKFNLGYGVAGVFIIHVDPKKIKQVISKLKEKKGIWLLSTVIGSEGNLHADFFVDSFEKYNKLLDQIHELDGVEKIEKHVYTQMIKEDYSWGAAAGDED